MAGAILLSFGGLCLVTVGEIVTLFSLLATLVLWFGFHWMEEAFLWLLYCFCRQCLDCEIVAIFFLVVLLFSPPW